MHGGLKESVIRMCSKDVMLGWVKSGAFDIYGLTSSIHETCDVGTRAVCI